MKKYILVVLIFSILILLQGNLISQNSSNKPNAKIVFEEEEFDFGEVKSDSLLTHIFKFENPGTDTLFIKSVKGSWGCTASLLSSEVIPPGNSGELKVSFYTKNRAGLNKKAIYIHSNDQESPTKKIYVKAFIEKSVLSPKNPLLKWKRH